MDVGLAGKYALVTGGSRGIGRAIVLALAQQGVSVLACYQRESEAVTSLAAELEQLGTSNSLIQADISDETSVHHLIEYARQLYGSLDILVNNASIIGHASLEAMELMEWQRVLTTNLTGLYLVTRAALDLIDQGGSIINISSHLAVVGMRGKAHYTASKAGMIGFTRSLCKEVGVRGIRANVISPGLIETEQIADLSPEQRSRYAYLSALNRLGQPEDVAGAVLFLASDLSRYMSGTVTVIDGGLGGVSAI